MAKLSEEAKKIIVGIQAFHKPISKAGIGDIIFLLSKTKKGTSHRRRISRSILKFFGL